MQLGRFGHHPEPLIDAEVECDRLMGLLAEAHAGLLRALDLRTETPEGQAVRADVRDALRRTGYKGSSGQEDCRRDKAATVILAVLLPGAQKRWDCVREAVRLADMLLEELDRTRPEMKDATL